MEWWHGGGVVGSGYLSTAPATGNGGGLELSLPAGGTSQQRGYEGAARTTWLIIRVLGGIHTEVAPAIGALTSLSKLRVP